MGGAEAKQGAESAEQGEPTETWTEEQENKEDDSAEPESLELMEGDLSDGVQAADRNIQVPLEDTEHHTVTFVFICVRSGKTFRTASNI